MLLETLAPQAHQADIEAKLWNGKQGRNPHRLFRASHLVTTPLPLRLEGRTEAEQHILQTAENVLAQLSGHDRWVCMERFIGLLRQALGFAAPWAVSGASLDGNCLSALIDGGGSRLPLIDFATMGIGSGDAACFWR